VDSVGFAIQALARKKKLYWILSVEGQVKSRKGGGIRSRRPLIRLQGAISGRAKRVMFDPREAIFFGFSKP